MFEELGGELRLSTPVKSVELVKDANENKHRITDGNGGVEEFDLVVSNADVHHNYKKLYSSSKVAQKRAKKLENGLVNVSIRSLFWNGHCL